MLLSLRRFSAVIAVSALVATGLVVVAQQAAEAATIAVNVNQDIVAATSPDGQCDADPNTAGNQCSLREAIVEANFSPLDDIIRLFTATNQFALTIPPGTGPTGGPNDVFGRDGDLDVIGNLQILPSPDFPRGVIDASALGDRVLDVEPSANPAATQRFSLQQLSIIGGTATAADGAAHGGAVRMESGELALRDVIFRDNTAGNDTDGIVGRGGAVYLESGRILSVQIGVDGPATDIVVDGNRAVAGGGVYAPDGDSSFASSSFTDNAAVDDHGGGAFLGGGVVSIASTTFSDNTTDDDGGGIRVANATSLDLRDTTFLRNVAEGDEPSPSGGAVFTSGGGAVTIRGGTFSDNRGQNGGAFDLGTDSTVTIAPSATQVPTFTGNVATRFGGAIRTRSQTTVDGAVFTGNRGDRLGGAYYNEASSGDSTITASTFTDNSSVGEIAPDASGTPRLTGGEGGAIGTGVTRTTTVTDSVFTGNSATRLGGAISFTGNTVTGVVTGNTFTDNRATGGTTPQGGDVLGRGGAVAATNSRSLTLHDNVFDAASVNTAEVGGAIWLNNVDADLGDVDIRNHTADLGGAVAAMGSDVLVTGGSFVGNRAATDGGAIHQVVGRLTPAPDFGSLTLVDTILDDNTATAGAGGAVFVDNARLETSGGTVFTANRAATTGGAIHLDSTSLPRVDRDDPGSDEVASTVTGTVVGRDDEPNEAAAGGGLWVGPQDEIDVDRSTFTGNLATVGAGIHTAGVTTRLIASDLSRNVATDSGGGIAAVGGRLEVTRSSLQANAADAGGAGIDVADAASVGVVNTTFTGQAGAGAAVVTAGTTTLRSTSIIDSTATGPAAVVATAGDLTIGGLLVEDGVASCDLTAANADAEGGNVVDDASCAVDEGALVATAGVLATEPAGLTVVHPLPVGSPAVDAGGSCLDLDGQSLDEDQRGVTRPQEGDADAPAACDAGAFELADGLLVTAGDDAFEAGPVAGSFTVTRLGNDLSGDLVVTYTVLVDGELVDGSQVVADDGEVTIPDGQASAEIAIVPVADDVAEPHATVTLVVPDQGGRESNAADAASAPTITLFDDDAVVTIAPGREGDEAGPVDATFTLTRTGDTSGELTVRVARDDTADDGVGPDDVDVPETVTFAAGEATATLVVGVVDDEELEGAESLTIELVPTDPATYVIGTPASASVLVQDDDVEVRIETRSDAAEPGSNGAVRVVRAGDLRGDLTVDLTVEPTSTATVGDDVAAPPASVVIPDGDAAVEQAIAVIDDAEAEPTETLVLSIAVAAPAVVAADGGTTTVEVLDDEVATVSVAATITPAAEPDQDGEVTFTRTSSATALTFGVTYGGDAVIGVDVAADDSGAAFPPTYTFDAGVNRIVVPVVVLDDGMFEATEQFTVSIDQDDPVNDTYAVSTTAGSATVEVVDDEAVVSLAVTTADASEPGDDGLFTVSRTGDTSEALTVDYAIGGTAEQDVDATIGEDASATSGSVTIPAGEGSATIAVVVIDDGLPEDAETVTVSLTAAPDRYRIEGEDTGTVTIADDDVVVTVVAFDADASEPDDDGAFRISREGGDPTAAVTVAYTVGGDAVEGEDFAELSGTATILGNTTTVDVMVDVLDDELVEGTEEVVLTVTDTDTDDYAPGDPSVATVVIADDDVDVRVAATDPDAAEPGDDGAFTFTRMGTTGSALTVTYTVSGTTENGVDHDELTGSVRFPAGQTTVVVPVTIIDDELAEGGTVGTESVGVTLDGDDTETAVVTIQDDDVEVAITLLDGEAAEPDDDGAVRVSRVGDQRSAVDVDLRATGTATPDADHDTPTTVTIAAEASSVEVAVAVVDDDEVEDTETVVLSLGSSDAFEVGADDVVTVTIADDDDAAPTPTETETETPTETETDTEAPAPTPSGIVRRLSGATRVETAVVIAADAFPNGSDVVVLARADDYPDALTGGPLAAALDAPLLLTAPAALDRATAREIQRLGASRVVLLGGATALSSEVEASVRDLGIDDVDRLDGADRFATAARIADELLDTLGATTAASVFVTEGVNADPSRGWPDAVSVAPLAAFQGRPILLVASDGLPDATADALASIGATRAVVAGGPVAVSDAVVAEIEALAVRTTRVAGDTRYATSRAVADLARTAGMSPASTWFATGRNFADALVGGPAIARDGGVLLLVDGTTVDTSAPAFAWLDEFREDIERLTLLGGPAAISDAVAGAAEQRLTR